VCFSRQKYSIPKVAAAFQAEMLTQLPARDQLEYQVYGSDVLAWQPKMLGATLPQPTMRALGNNAARHPTAQHCSCLTVLLFLIFGRGSN
jgi:hypothetical protein